MYHAPMRSRPAAAALVLACWSVTAVSWAQPPAEARARELAAEAKVHYGARRCDKAAELLVEANRLHPEPTVLYNLGLAHECAGNRAAAADAYRRFLVEASAGATKSSAERHLAELERQIAEDDRRARQMRALEQARLRAEANARLVEDQLRRSRAIEGEPPSLSPWPVVLGAGGVVGIGAGVALGLLSSSREDDAQAEVEVTRSRDLHDDAGTLATGANVAFVAGGILLATGVVWAIVDLSRSPAPRVTGAMRR
jgi:tetratricopeptide (TPR) repeat protein